MGKNGGAVDVSVPADAALLIITHAVDSGNINVNKNKDTPMKSQQLTVSLMVQSQNIIGM